MHAVLVLAAAVALLSPFATASKHKVENQLQTARIPERDQRLEFPLEGDDSAFKFSFVEDGVSCRRQCTDALGGAHYDLSARICRRSHDMLTATMLCR